MIKLESSKGILIDKMELLDLARLVNRKNKKIFFNKKGVFGGKFLSKIKGRGMEFSESRLYQPGDDVRNIDWKVTARSGKTHTKLFREERERPVMLILDQSCTMFFGSHTRLKSVQAARIASLFGWQAIKNGDRVGAIMFSETKHQEFRPKSEKNNFLRLLSNIMNEHNNIVYKMNVDEWSFKNEFLLAHALRRLRHVVHPGSLIYVISDFLGYNDECKKHFFQLSKHSQVKAVLVKDPLEEKLTFRTPFAVSDGENNTLLNAGSDQVRKKYSMIFKKNKESLENELRLCSINLLTVSTNDENPYLGK